MSVATIPKTEGTQALTPCLSCGRLGVGRCRRRRCVAGVELWSQDVWTVLVAMLQHVANVRLVVLTAPGADRLPWDLRKCRHGARVACSGSRGCVVDERARDDWEADVQHRWALLRTAVVTRLERRGLPSPLLGWVDEDQRRGAWHRNVMLSESPSAVAFHQELAQLAPRYGFGFVDRNPVVMEGVRASAYLVGYLTGARAKKQATGATLETHVRRAPTRRRVWVAAPMMTKRTGVTMTSLANGRRVWASEQGWCKRPLAGLAVLDWRVVDVETGEARSVWLVRRESTDPP